MHSKNAATKTAVARTVDEYLERVPAEARATLEKLRQTIRVCAPKAVEGISYGMPMFKYEGMLVAFAAFKNHCSLFAGTGVIAAHQEDLKRYDTSKGTVRFPTSKPLPAALVKKLVKARIRENEAKAARRASAKAATAAKKN